MKDKPGKIDKSSWLTGMLVGIYGLAGGYYLANRALTTETRSYSEMRQESRALLGKEKHEITAETRFDSDKGRASFAFNTAKSGETFDVRTECKPRHACTITSIDVLDR